MYQSVRIPPEMGDLWQVETISFYLSKRGQCVSIAWDFVLYEKLFAACITVCKLARKHIWYTCTQRQYNYSLYWWAHLYFCHSGFSSYKKSPRLEWTSSGREHSFLQKNFPSLRYVTWWTPHYMWTNTCTTLYLRVGVSTQSISLCWSCSHVSMLPLELQNEKIKTLLTTGSRGAKTKNVHYCYNCFTFRAGYIDTIKYTCNVYYSFRTGRIRNCRDKHGCCSSLPHFRQ